MPTVPQSFVPSVGQTAMNPTPVQAPNVVPMQNRNPEQLQELGQTLQQAGGMEFRTGQTIGDAVAAQVDDTKVKTAEASALANETEVNHNAQTGYMNLRGQAAVDAYEPAKQAIVKGYKDAEDGLSNDLQRFMFKQLKQRQLLDIGQKMGDHAYTQTVSAAATASRARAESYSLQALRAMDSRYQVDEKGAPVGEFAKYVGQVKQEVMNAAHLAGFEPDSAQAQSMLREQMTSLNHGIISSLLDNHDAYGAKKWFDEQSAAGNIDMRNIEQLGAAVKSEYDQQHVTDVAQQIMATALTGGKRPITLAMPISGSSINVTAGLGDPRSGGRSHDGIDIAVPVGTNVMAPAVGKVLKVWNDDKFGGGLSVEMQLPNGMTAGFAHLSAANVREGDEIQQGSQLGLSGKSGNATGPTLHYMMKDADGKYVDPRQVSQPQPNREGFADPNALDQALKTLDSRGDLDSHQKKQVATLLESAHSHYRAIQNQQYTDIMQKATDAFYQSGGVYAAIPADVRLALRPEDKYKFRQGIPKKDNVDVQAQFILDDKNQTTEWVQAHRMDFSDGTYLSLLNKVQYDQNSPDKEKNASLDATQMNDLLFRNGMANLARPILPSDKEAAVALKSRIMDQFVSEQNATKTPLTRDRKAQIIKQTIVDQVSVHGTFWDDKNKPVVGLNADDMKNAYVTVGSQKVKLAAIPVQDQRQITAALRRTNQPVTQQSIANYWVKAQTRLGKQVPTF